MFYVNSTFGMGEKEREKKESKKRECFASIDALEKFVFGKF